MTQPKKLVTTALVYANGPLHLGHLVEQIQADIWVRNNRLSGNTRLFISGDDAHGTPIMLSAEKQGITPEALVASIHAEHRQDSARFLIDFDHYSHTHHPHCTDLVQHIFTKLDKAGHIAKKTIMQAYDNEKGLFLLTATSRAPVHAAGQLTNTAITATNVARPIAQWTL